MYRILLPLLLLTINCAAQNETIKQVSKGVSIAELKKNLYYLASEKMEGRGVATNGDTMASLYIADHFKRNGIQPAFDNGTNYFQAVPINRKSGGTSTIAIANKEYPNLNGWYFALSPSTKTELKNVPVVYGGNGIEDSRYNDFANIDVKGKAVILLQGQPKNGDGTYLLSGTTTPAALPSPEAKLIEKGAVAIIMYLPRFAPDPARVAAPVSSAGFTTARSRNARPTLATVYFSEERMNELLAPANVTIKELVGKTELTLKSQSMPANNTISINLDVVTEKKVAPNVIGVIKGSDANAGAIILSAHHDHVGIVGGVLHPGAVDNASGTVAIMEVARLMNEATAKGQRPKRTIIFASYTGEEIGLVGSSYLAENPVVPVEKTHAVLNIDMMGRVDTFYSGRRADSMYAYILVKDTLNRGLRKSLLDAHEASGQELKLDPYYEQPQFMQRRLTGSDQYPFFVKGIPFIRIDCGFSKDYHKPTDTPDKINYELLQKQVRLTFLTIWNLANN